MFNFKPTSQVPLEVLSESVCPVSYGQLTHTF